MNFKMDQTAIVGSTLSWVVDGKRVEAESAEGLENCDFDGNGSITLADGQALLDYVTGVRDAISHADAADLDQDGGVDTFDAYLFYRQMGKCSVEVPANGSVHVSLTVTLDKETMDYVDEFSSGTGAYVEGYVYADEMSSAEGVTGTSHSIPCWATTVTGPTLPCMTWAPVMITCPVRRSVRLTCTPTSRPSTSR